MTFLLLELVGPFVGVQHVFRDRRFPLDDYPLEIILSKPKKVAPNPTTELKVIATAMYGAIAALTDGVPSFGMQNQSTAPAPDNTTIPSKNKSMVLPPAGSRAYSIDLVKEKTRLTRRRKG
jgi:hypothetical protein